MDHSVVQQQRPGANYFGPFRFWLHSSAVERSLVKRMVVGSIPTGASIYRLMSVKLLTGYHKWHLLQLTLIMSFVRVTIPR